jgi:hypothetical protein
MVEGVAWAFFFPAGVIYPSAGVLIDRETEAGAALISLLWATTVYLLFLAGRWTWRQLRRPRIT